MGRRTVLVADDHVDAGESLATLLRLLGHEVRVVNDGLAAVAAAAAAQPEVALLDVGMPQLDGYEAGRRIRSLPGGDRVVLAALTGWSRAEDRKRTEEAGFNHHLVKPVSLDDLQRVLAELSPS